MRWLRSRNLPQMNPYTRLSRSPSPMLHRKPVMALQYQKKQRSRYSRKIKMMQIAKKPSALSQPCPNSGTGRGPSQLKNLAKSASSSKRITIAQRQTSKNKTSQTTLARLRWVHNLRQVATYSRIRHVQPAVLSSIQLTKATINPRQAISWSPT